MTREERKIQREIAFADFWLNSEHNGAPTYADAIAWADKTTLGKACQFLREEFYAKEDRDGHNELVSASYTAVEELIEHFQKAMEE